jgi:sigma-B regulation protein RsbU (phosphoserine phosphatase)
LCFAIADVSGKGIPAALLMTSVRVAFRQEARPGIAPGDLVGRLNEVVSALGSEGFFTCFFCGIWTPTTGLLRFCNAGLEPPVVFRHATRYRQALKKGGPVLGIVPQAHYREGAVRLVPGDRVFLYTDGLTDEQDANGQFFDSPHLLDLVSSHLSETADALLDQVFSAVEAFGGAGRTDDRTAIILEIKNLQK